MEGPLVIRPMVEADWPAVARIYAEGIATGQATLETDVPDWAEWDRSHDTRCRLIAQSGVTAAWAALSPVSKRLVYSGVAEVSIYVAEVFRGDGVGSALLSTLVHESEKEGFWMLQAGIFPENEASIAIHERHGFRVVGVRERIGRMNGAWRDVALLERRSPLVND